MIDFQFETKVAGSQYYFEATKVEPRDALFLKLDLLNHYDRNAIEILHNNKCIGFIPRDLARTLKKLIERKDLNIVAECAKWNSQYEIFIKITGHIIGK